MGVCGAPMSYIIDISMSKYLYSCRVECLCKSLWFIVLKWIFKDRPALPPEVLSNQLLCIALLLFLRPHCCWGINSRWTEQITKFNIHTTKEGKQSSGSYSQSNSKIWLHVYPSSAISESPYQTQNLFQSINQINRRLQLTKQH